MFDPKGRDGGHKCPCRAERRSHGRGGKKWGNSTSLRMMHAVGVQRVVTRQRHEKRGPFRGASPGFILWLPAFLESSDDSLQSSSFCIPLTAAPVSSPHSCSRCIRRFIEMSENPPTTHAAEDLIASPTTAPQRKRPLRTYGRRSRQSRELEQAAATTEGSTPGANPDPADVPSPSSPRSPPARDQKNRLNRGSILAYFKPSIPSSDGARAHPPSSSAAPVSTPPSSPPSLPRSRKRRRLTTRPQFCGNQQTEGNPLGDGTQAGEELGRDTESLHSSTRIDEFTIVVNTEGDDSTPSPLSEVGVNVLHNRAQSARSTPNPGATCKPPPVRRRAKEMTQTTLSLSVHKEPGFTICSVCDLLYNPLNEKDRREHRRRHAAYTRAKARPA
ncbi:hypothetical protein VTK26DRAFT_1135 [Humicola hyalothermophila]